MDLGVNFPVDVVAPVATGQPPQQPQVDDSSAAGNIRPIRTRRLQQYDFGLGEGLSNLLNSIFSTTNFGVKHQHAISFFSSACLMAYTVITLMYRSSDGDHVKGFVPSLTS